MPISDVLLARGPARAADPDAGPKEEDPEETKAEVCLEALGGGRA